VGMLVDVSVILSGPQALIVAATLSIVALFGKWMAAFFTQLAFKYTKAQRQLVFGLSSAHAAATLAVILVGFNAGILDENILNGTIILILITCVVASFATERAAKIVLIETEDDHTDLKRANGYNDEHILLPFANIENIEKLLEFAIFIKDKKSQNPIAILSVVSNNDEAEVNILKTRNRLEKFVIQASASEINVNVIATIDHNIGSGISRIAKEIMADIIVLGWPRKKGLLDKLIGEKVDSILSNTTKTTFICHLEKPLVLHKRIVVVVPPLAERENGFEQWFFKVISLARELSVPIVIHCNQDSEDAVQNFIIQAKISTHLTFKSFDDWDNFFVLGNEVGEDDLFVLVSARKGSPSFIGQLENLPSRLEKHFSSTSRLVIYPQQFNQQYGSEVYSDISGETWQKGDDLLN
jgi:hypothetical protein